MARMRIAEIIAVAALAGSLAACGSSSSKPTAAAATGTSTDQAAPVSSATTTPGNAATSTTAANAATTSPSAPPTTQPSARSSATTSNAGGGVANAGDHATIVGTLQYLAPGKFLVHPDDGSTDQGFYVSDATRILGAAAICGGPDGNVTIGGDGYGTTKCTEDQLETAAKTGSVKVRVTMNRKTGDVASVEEKYHP